MKIPLYTRSSDRSIASCPAQWHISNQGIEENTASWFEIGTALHLVAQHCIEREWSLKHTVRKAVEYVANHIQRGEEEAPMLWSHNRPRLDEVSRHGEVIEGTERLSRRLITQWWEDWMLTDGPTSGPVIMPRLSWPPMLELFIEVSEADTPEGLAGIKTQVDALFTCRVCRGHVIVDWKTGRTLRHDPVQLQTYRYGLETGMGLRMCGCKEGWGFFYNMEDGSLQQVTDYDWTEVEWMMASTQKTKRDEPIVAIPSWKCDWCVGRSVCPAWQQDPVDAEAAQILLDLNRERYIWVSDPTPTLIEEPSPDDIGDIHG